MEVEGFNVLEEKIAQLQKQINELAAKRAIKEKGLKKYSRMSLEQKDMELNQNIARLNELIKEDARSMKWD